MKYFKKLIKEGIYSKEKNGFIASLFGATGFISFYILCLLKDKPLYGEEIRKAIYKATENTWNPNPGFIYPILKEMRKDGLIEGKWDLENVHPRHIYKITIKGLEQYERTYDLVKIKFTDLKNITEKLDKEVFNE
jgi:PadR family transcriptional regulator PadR